MGVAVVTGAQCACSFGTAPCVLNCTSQVKVLADGKPVATVQDMSPGTNITPFAMCTSLANPAVASATAAALGVLTPQPCTPTPAGPWMPGDPKKLLDSQVVLTADSSLMCSLGLGKISIVNPGQTKIMI